ncbi:hypothetical protein CPB85DRAFT_1351758 [Mucidula mucida]|nr:hypothetical protein CPB85DRAFT_1351758 [Mucidula mucida]
MITSRIGMSCRSVLLSRLPRLQANITAPRPINNFSAQRLQRPFSSVTKSGSNWTLADLESFNIRLRKQSALKFFGVQKLPQPEVHPELLNVRDAEDMTEDRHAQLITLLDIVMGPKTDKSVIVDFAIALFRVMDYIYRERVECSRNDFYLVMCGEYRHAGTACSIIDRFQNDILLLHVQNNEDQEPANAQAQLVVMAVAAFTNNNTNRVAAGRAPLSGKVMPGIVMVGSTPIFFKIPITESLSSHILHGTYPPDVTSVTFCKPPVPRPDRWKSEGMKPLDSRRQILSCYEAFKKVVGI